MHDEAKPWGRVRDLYRDPDVAVRLLTVNASASTSYKSHLLRQETWQVVFGKATVILDDKKVYLNQGDSILIPPGSKHRVINRTISPLMIVEIQSGEELSNEDFIRYEDKYARDCVGE